MFKDGCQHSASSPRRSVPSHLFLWLFASKEISVSERLLFFFMVRRCSPFRGCWDALFIPGPQNLCAVCGCWGIDRAQWWTGSVSPAANQKVNSLSIEEGKWPPRACTSLPCTLNSNLTAFDFVCVRTERSGPASEPPSIPILPFDAFLHQEIIFSENPSPSLKAEREAGLRHFSRFSPFTCSFLSWELKAVFVNAKLESNLVMTSPRLYVRLGWLKLPANIPIGPLAIGAWKACRRMALCYCE